MTYTLQICFICLYCLIHFVIHNWFSIIYVYNNMQTIGVIVLENPFFIEFKNHKLCESQIYKLYYLDYLSDLLSLEVFIYIELIM